MTDEPPVPPVVPPLSEAYPKAVPSARRESSFFSTEVWPARAEGASASARSERVPNSFIAEGEMKMVSESRGAGPRKGRTGRKGEMG